MTPEIGLTPLAQAEDDAVTLLRDMIRIDSTNTGHADDTVGEAGVAEYVEAALQEVGYEPERFETTAANRQGVYLRIPGADPERGALLLHGHLDVVAAFAEDWQVPPFGGELSDGLIWGRGAVDMKDMDAMLLATLRHWARTDHVPPREIVVIFTPDEEAGGYHGAHWIVDNRPDMLHNVTEAVGEVGGFSMTVRDDLRFYLIQTAEKGIAWLNLRAEGQAGHGSMLNDANAVTQLAKVVSRVGDHKFPVTLTPTTSAFLAELAEALDTEIDPTDTERLLELLGPLARVVGATMQNSVNPSMLSAGYKVNVIPGHAEAFVDGRFLPGHEEEMIAEVDRLLADDAVREFVHHDVALETSFDGPTIAAMGRAIQAEDPIGKAVPYMLSGGTDAKAWSRKGIRCFGFAPLKLPPDLDFGAMFHGVDERVPADAIQFGVRVLNRFLAEV
ncbi:MAG: M20/M25/M40 family metallo-hydrolase [Actinomycetia bacterium]|nr:M20/M25/M40 family metallo-hydrolase [Actinomycetes bacterium]